MGCTDENAQRGRAIYEFTPESEPEGRAGRLEMTHLAYTVLPMATATGRGNWKDLKGTVDGCDLPLFHPNRPPNGENYYRSKARAHLLISVDFDLSSSLQKQSVVAFHS